ncbi:unnamed protein product [Effrenium voratum]|uniref:EF-hand domain-containing protein n=1 Tax=Effrenium voratum TaxID=2562239 RepID=A0AA36HNC3_9DINO|nr:unnamed protein product [Effrenium voratum]CAJ1371529.1 unnamed protein product [Effrenium voratum]CAJ1456281.1 unnamed protein product [Effrenium voratum]
MATNDASKLTSQGYHAYRKANDQVKGAKAPQGIDATMALTSQSDLKVAFEMLDVNKEGTLGKKQARDFLRCAGWCLPDDDLDAMLVGQLTSSGARPSERTKWNLKMLTDLLDQNQHKENSSVSAVQQSLRRLANNRAKISRERVLEFISQDHDLTEADIDQVLGAVGMGGAKLIDCDQLAAKLLDRICNPPSVLEMHELGT